MAHTYSNNPKRIYVNLSASALSSSAQLGRDPEANFYTTRNVPIVDNIALYKLAIVRAAIQGQRNLPLLIASIVTGQDDPYLTNYIVSLTLTFGGTPVAVPPLAGPPAVRYISLNAIGSDGTARASANISVPSGPASADAAAVAATITAALATSADPLLLNVTCAAGVGSILTFTNAHPELTPGWTFNVCVQDADAATFFGFYTAQLVLASIGSLNGASVVLPAPCSYTSAAPQFSTTSSQNMQWIPQTPSLPSPAPPIVSQDSDNEAYWLYDYAWFSRLLNTTFQTAYAQVLSTAAGSGFSLPLNISGGAPSVVYVPSAKGFRLTAPAGLFNGGAVTLSITLNEELANLMNWPGTYDAVGNQTLIWDSAEPSTSNTGAAILALTPEYPATGNAWSPVGSIVFGFSQWPARAEILSPPIQYGSGSASAVSSNDETYQILSDVIPQVLDSSDYVSQNIIYSPQILRWIDMPGQNCALRTMDFKVSWRNNLTGSILPLSLNPTSSVSIKILLQLCEST